MSEEEDFDTPPSAEDEDVDQSSNAEEDTKLKRGKSLTASEPDDYDNMDENAQPAFTLATLGLQRVGTIPPPKPKAPQAPVQMLNARGMPARIRKRNRFFYDENIINDDKPLRMSLSPKKLPFKTCVIDVGGSGGGGGNDTIVNNISAQHQQQQQQRGGLPRKVTPVTTPSKVLKKRKGVVSRYMRSEQEQQQQKKFKKKLSVNAVNRNVLKAAARTYSGGNISSSSAGGVGVSSSGSVHISNNKKIKQMTAAAQTNKLKRRVAASSAAGGGNLKKRIKSENGNNGNEHDLTAATDDKAAGSKQIGQSLGLSLRNLLKLPKAHKWAIAEWFYSYVDKPLFNGDCEFLTFINALYPGLSTHQLTRGEWRYIRRSIGKPRRCSQAFFDEERRELERKRKLLRTLQSRKPGELKDLVSLHDMPDKIPMPLPVGTNVTARLRYPQDGIFTGSVDAYDSLHAIYRVTFERPGLGTHSIPDFEIVSENFHEMLPLHTFTKDFRPNLVSIFNGNAIGRVSTYTTPQKPHVLGGIMGVRSALNMKLNKSDPLLGQEAIAAISPYKSQLSRNHGYPPKLLENLVRLRRATDTKSAKVQRLSNMNNEAELQVANNEATSEYGGNESGTSNDMILITDEFQRRYASNIISIEKLNYEIMMYLNDVQKFSAGLSRDPHVQAMIAPTYLREQCRAVANRSVERLNNGVAVKHEKMMELIKNLTTLLLIASRIGADSSAHEVGKVLEGCMEEVRSSLVSRDNASVFHKNVQLPLHHLSLNIGRNISHSNSVITKSKVSGDDKTELTSKQQNKENEHEDEENVNENENENEKDTDHEEDNTEANGDDKIDDDEEDVDEERLQDMPEDMELGEEEHEMEERLEEDEIEYHEELESDIDNNMEEEQIGQA